MTRSPFPGRVASSDRHALWFRFLVCCGIAIFGLRAFFVQTFGASVAFGDDLDGIAYRTLLPWLQGTLTLNDLFAVHNGDHRIVGTRLWELLWFLLNGHTWDPKLVMITKAVIYALAATIFIHLFARGLERHRWLAGGVLAALFAFPFSYQNLLWAFQSQFDFFMLFTALGWWALLSGRITLALSISVFALFTVASGALVSASFVPYLALAWWRKKWPLSRSLALIAACVAIFAFGASLRTPENALPHTGSNLDRLSTLARLYAWPHSNLTSVVERLPESSHLIPAPVRNFPSAEHSYLLRLAETLRRHPFVVVAAYALLGLFVLAPTLTVGVGVWRKRIPLAVALAPLNLSVFAGLMLTATAVARSQQVTIAGRYLDYVMLPAMISVVCVFILARHAPQLANARAPRVPRWLFAWAIVMAAGYLATMGAALLQMKKRPTEPALNVLRAYYVANDPAVLRENQAFKLFIVSDEPSAFIHMLNTPGLRAALPLAVVSPDAPQPFATRIAALVGQAGLALACFAAGGAFGCAWRARQQRRRRAGAPGLVASAPAKA